MQTLKTEQVKYENSPQQK